MDKQLETRRPVPQKHHGLSTVSKIFFGVDIFQVVVVVVFQSIMIGCGNFNAYNSPENPGMGPGRRVYMFVYMGVIVYTCFLCLFAVKQQNFLEILAFLLQNFAFVTYGLIQVYHFGYKKLPLRDSNVTAQHNPLLRNAAMANSLTLFFLNGVFIFLSWKLYIEFGWKIYKRVRFNISLRSIYHFYQLLACLLKMAIMYWWMYAICNSFVLLQDHSSPLYYINLAFIPTSIVYACLGYIATQREIKVLMTIFILWTLGLIGYFIYKLLGFLTDTCTGCQEFHTTGKDLHDEAILHFVYLGTLNLLLLLAILGVSCKVFSNFGKGLAQHFKPNKDGRRPRLATDLYLRRVSHYIEESVVSATSYESEHDELQGSMKSSYQQIFLTTGIPLLSNNEQLLAASSLPNIFEAAQKSQTFPASKDKSPVPMRCQLAVIDEDDDLKTGRTPQAQTKYTSPKRTVKDDNQKSEKFERFGHGNGKTQLTNEINREKGKSNQNWTSELKSDVNGQTSWIKNGIDKNKNGTNEWKSERTNGIKDTIPQRKCGINERRNGTFERESGTHITNNEITERSASCPLKQVTTSNKNSKNSFSTINSSNEYDIDDGDDDVFVDRTGERDSRDSGFMDNLPKLKTHRIPHIQKDKVIKETEKDNVNIKDSEKGPSPGIGRKSKISLFNGKTT